MLKLFHFDIIIYQTNLPPTLPNSTTIYYIPVYKLLMTFFISHIDIFIHIDILWKLLFYFKILKKILKNFLKQSFNFVQIQKYPHTHTHTYLRKSPPRHLQMISTWTTFPTCHSTLHIDQIIDLISNLTFQN